MTAEVGNWVGELTATVGTGSITLAGPISGFAPFSSIGDADVWYAIIDGVDKEAGKGTLVGDILQRTEVYSTLVSGVYNGASPGPLDLTGSATVYSTFNKTSFDEFSAAVTKLATIESGATADQIAADVPYDNSTSALVAVDVQAAIDEIDSSLDTVSGSLGTSSALDTGTAPGELPTNSDLDIPNKVVQKDSTTGAADLPVGTIAQRPVAPSAGMFRYNGETAQFEGYSAGAWSGVGGASGGAGNPIMYEHDAIASEDYTLVAGKNSVSGGPFTIADGTTITVESGAAWTVV